MTFSPPFLEEGVKSSNTAFENDPRALLCMLTTSLLLSCFGFMVIVRQSMQVYNYFLIKTQCAWCFYKWRPLVWLGWGCWRTTLPEGGMPVPLPLIPWGGTSASCMFGAKKATRAGGADLWQPVGDAPAALARLETPMGPTEMTRVPLEEVGRFQGQRWWGEGQDEQWRSHFALRS